MCHYNNPYDEVCDALALDFIKQGVDEMFLCKVAKATTSKEAWKILEAEFGARGSNQVKDHSVIQPVEEVFEDEIEDGSVIENLQKSEDFFESHLKVDHNIDSMLPTGVDFGIDNVPSGE